MGNEKIVQVNGVDLCFETFGAPGDPAVLLLAGLSMSMDHWRDEFCQRLATAGRFVIRYDLRDNGRSVTYPSGAPEYTGADLERDALGLLDALGLDSAHLVGLSAGGGIAQVLAIEQPDRIASLTLMCTTSGSDDDLPPPAPELQARFTSPPPEPDWSDRAAVIDHLLADLRAFAGSLPWDEDDMRALAERIVDRTIDMASSMKNNWLIDHGGEPIRPRLGRITAPTLVIHGTEDPLFPLEHGEALAREIAGARFLPLERVGHEVPPRATWDTVITALVAHTC
jgi:pimeloyl-ACP methyl ester carboxylesterase